MKKTLFLAIFFILSGIITPCFCEDNSSYMSLDEYSRFFEMGFMDEQDHEEAKEDEEFEPEIVYTPILKEKIDTKGGNVISVESSPFVIKIEKNNYLDTYREVFKPIDTRSDLYKNDKFTLFSNNTKELSDYMTNNLKSTMNVSYDFNDSVSLRAGHEVWYVNPNASIGARKFYLNPHLNLTNNLFFDFTGRYNQTSKNLEQEVGLNYKPSLFRDAASFGVKASTVINNETHKMQSNKLKFTTDLYIF